MMSREQQKWNETAVAVANFASDIGAVVKLICPDAEVTASEGGKVYECRSRAGSFKINIFPLSDLYPIDPMSRALVTIESSSLPLREQVITELISKARAWGFCYSYGGVDARNRTLERKLWQNNGSAPYELVEVDAISRN